MMPVVNTYASIVGEPPSPHKMTFLPWVDRYFYLRSRYCDFKRATTYYIDPDTGSDSNNGTLASPWASLTNVRAALKGVAGVGSNTWASPVTNTAFLLKRGTIIRDSTITDGGCLVIKSVGIEIGSYGPMVPGVKTGCVEPVISNFTIQWLNGFTITTPGGAANRRTISLTASATVLNPANVTRIGWIRWDRSVNNKSVDAIVHPNAPFAYASGTSVVAGQDATATALVESTPYSFYVDSTGGLVHINFDGLDGLGIANTASSTTCLEATPGLTTNSLNYDGIRVSTGSDQCYIHDILIEGYGCQSESYQNASGIRVGNGSEDVCLLRRVRSYYGGRHLLSQECDDPINHYGGVLIKEQCKVGYSTLAGGQVIDVAFSNSGNIENACDWHTIEFGPLPTVSLNTTLYAANQKVLQGQVDKNGSFYGHSGGSGGSYQPARLIINRNTRIIDNRGRWPNATCAREGFGYDEGTTFLAGTETDPTTYRAFVIGYHSPRTVSAQTPFAIASPSRVLFVNCKFYYDIAWTGQAWIYEAKTNSLYLNCMFEVDYQETMSITNGLALCFHRQTSAPTIEPRYLNCDIRVRGSNLDGYFAITQNRFGASNFGIRMGNCLISSIDSIRNGYTTRAFKVCLGTGGFTATDIPANSSTYLRGIATYGVLKGNVSPGGVYANGFNQAMGWLDLETAGVEIPGVIDGYSGQGLLGSAGIMSQFVHPLSADSPLIGAGYADPFGDQSNVGMLPAPEYDILGNRRPSVPSIGTVDINNTNYNSGGGSGFQNGGVSAMVRSLGFATGSVTTSAQALPGLGSISAPQAADIQAADGTIRYRLDGVNPTTSNGMLLSSGQSFRFEGDLDQVKIIATTGTVTVNVHYY